MDQEQDDIIGLPEEEAYLKIYGIVYDNTCALEEIVVLLDDQKLTTDNFADEATIHYMFGFDQYHMDGMLERYITIMRSIYGDNTHPISFFLEDLLAQGVTFYREYHAIINFEEAFELQYALSQDLSKEVYDKLLSFIDEQSLDQFMNAWFLQGLALAQTRPQYEIMGYSNNGYILYTLGLSGSFFNIGFLLTILY